LACPFFVPLEILNDGSWPHPTRLPLGAGWRGNCCATGRETPASDDHLRDFCNLGYAAGCPYLPHLRQWDAIRFSVAHVSRDQLTISYVCELAHAPVDFGNLIFDLASETWLDSAPLGQNSPVIRLANSYLHTYRARTAAAA
jgi:hypothetical protein